MKLNFVYSVEYKVLEDAFIKGNESYASDRIVSFDVNQLSKESRQNLLILSFAEVESEPPMDQIALWEGKDCMGEEYNIYLGHFEVDSGTSSPPVMYFLYDDLDKADLTLRDAEGWLTQMVESLKENRKLLKQALEEYRIAKRDQEVTQALEKALIENNKARERKKMLRWARTYGSERLRLGLELGYDCDRLYVTERANAEFPGFIVDYDDEAENYYQIDPGLEALKLVANLRKRRKAAHVVCLLTDLQGDKGDDIMPCEAVKLEGFLGMYNLYKLTE